MNQVHYVERKKGRLQHLKDRGIGFYRRFWILLLALAVIGVTAPQTLPFSGKCAEAHTLTPEGTDLQVGEYCYRMKVTVTNADSVTYNDQPAPFTVNAESLVSQGFIRSRGWDLRPVTTASLINMDMMAQSMTATSTTWWITVPTISAQQGATPSTFSGWIYTGNEYVQRNQGVQLTPLDRMTTPDSTYLNLDDDWEIWASISMRQQDTVGTSVVMQKWDSVTDKGYSLYIDDGYIKGKIGDGSNIGEVSYAYLGDGIDISHFKLRFVNPDLTLFKKDSLGAWNQVATQSTALTSVGASTGTALQLGGQFRGKFYDAQVRRLYGTSTYYVLAQWGFDPVDMVQTQEGDGGNGYVWQGTVANQRFSSYVMTYVFERSGNVKASVGAMALVFANPAENLPERFANVLGDPTSVNLFDTGAVNTRMPFYTTLENARADMGMPPDAWWLMIFGGIGGLIGLAIFQATRRVEMATVAPCATMLTASTMGLLAPYIPLLFGMGAVGVWLIGKWGTEA
jgi:hypothetical protein